MKFIDLLKIFYAGWAGIERRPIAGEKNEGFKGGSTASGDTDILYESRDLEWEFTGGPLESGEETLLEIRCLPVNI